MSNYNGIFLRSALGQGNTIPRLGPQSISPDILTLGIEPVPAPAIFAQRYDIEFKKPLLAQQANYIYLRGKNYSDQPIDDRDDTRPRLFCAKASLLLYPQTWTELNTGPSGEPFSLKADPGSVGATNRPYVWIPDNITSDHYCLIATVPSPGYGNNIPEGPISDFNTWVAAHGGVAWTGVNVVNANALTLSSKAMHFDMGSESAEIWFEVVSTNLPVGCTISFSAGSPGTDPAIYLAPTTVATSPKFTAGVKCSVPAGYISDIYFNLVVPSGSIPPGASVTIRAMYAPGDNADKIVASQEITL